jgi:uncharacterized protein (TIGR03382 family)
VLLLSALAALLPTSPEPPATAALAGPAWHTTKPSTVGRASPTAVLLRSGKVLVSGGSAMTGTLLATAELYDPTTDTWSPTGSMRRARQGHTATLLPSGKALVVGGGDTNEIPELYDPATGTWSDTPMDTLQPHDFCTATLLPSGLMLVAGTSGANGPSAAELYDPAAGTWTAAGSMAQPRYAHTATLLPSGKVLLVGGSWNNQIRASAELYDPAKGTWTAVGLLAQARSWHTATLLISGKVLVVGGMNSQGHLDTAELYDPATGLWTPTGRLSASHPRPTAVRLTSGKVLVVDGGNAPPEPSPVPELYDPAKGSWAPEESLTTPYRQGHTMTALPWGSVLIAGGDPARTAELYLREAGNHPPAAFLTQVTTTEDTPVAVTLSGMDLLGDALSYVVIQEPTQGGLSGTAPQLLYTPHPDFHGTDSFTYRASDDSLDSEPATVTLTVTPVKDPPRAESLSLTSSQGEPLNLVLAGMDPDGDAIEYTLGQLPAHGELLGTLPELTFVPYDGYGRDSFTYRVSDGSSESEVATVAITVTPRQIGCSSAETGAGSWLALLVVLARLRPKRCTSAMSASSPPRPWAPKVAAVQPEGVHAPPGA